MKRISAVVGILLIASFFVSANEYLEPTCYSILHNDLINLVKVEDLNGDGKPNILVGTSINGNLYNYVYSGAECTQDWTYNDGGWVFDTVGDVRSFQVGSFTLNKKNQILVNSAKSAQSKSMPPKEYAYVISPNGLIDWNYNEACGLSNSVSAADFDGNGIDNAILGCESKQVCALTNDKRTAVLWSYKTDNPVQYVAGGDINSDGSPEVVALDGKYKAAKVYILSSKGELLNSFELVNGYYTAALPSNIIDVADLQGDGKKDIVVGTSKGITVRSLNGLLWEKDLKNPVTAVKVVDIDGSGQMYVVVGSAPDVTAFNNKGEVLWKWTSDVARTIYSMSAYDVDGDGKKEIAVGAKGYVFVIDDNGKTKGSWKYRVEIQGGSKNYSERDASAAAIYIGNLDSDPEPEIITAWNWEEDTVRGNLYSSTLRVFNINKDYVPQPGEENAGAGEGTTTPTTSPSEQQVNPGNDGTTAGGDATETTLSSPETTDASSSGETKSKGMCCLPMLPALLALAASLAGKYLTLVR